jgi:hypothetical protein
VSQQAHNAETGSFTAARLLFILVGAPAGIRTTNQQIMRRFEGHQQAETKRDNPEFIHGKVGEEVSLVSLAITLICERQPPNYTARSPSAEMVLLIVGCGRAFRQSSVRQISNNYWDLPAR